MRVRMVVAIAGAMVAATVHADPDTIAGHDAGWWRAANEARAAEVETQEAAVAACEERESPPAYDGIAGYVTRGRDGRLREVEIKRCDDERADRDTARRELERFEEEARRLGIPPGWLR